MTHPQQLTLFPPTLHRPAPPPRRTKRQVRDGRGRHDNSLAAHQRIEQSSAITGRRAAIVAWLRDHGPATDREVAVGLFGSGADLNMVRPRITELLNAWALYEVDRVRDKITGMTVRRVGITGQ